MDTSQKFKILEKGLYLIIASKYLTTNNQLSLTINGNTVAIAPFTKNSEYFNGSLSYSAILNVNDTLELKSQTTFKSSDCSYSIVLIKKL